MNGLRIIVVCAAVIALACADRTDGSQSTTINTGSLYQSINTRDITSLTFHKNRLTTARRTSAIPQLNCVGGDACDYSHSNIDVVSCQNVGFDGRSVQWRCSGSMSDYVRLGTTTVSCEGFSKAGDINVLVGSCGLKYTLHLTEKGKSVYHRKPTAVPVRPVRPDYGYVRPRPVIVRSSSYTEERIGFALVLIGLFAAILGIWSVCACSSGSKRITVTEHHYGSSVDGESYAPPPAATAPAYVSDSYDSIPVPPPPPQAYVHTPFSAAVRRRRVVEEVPVFTTPVVSTPVVSQSSAQSSANRAYVDGMVTGAVLSEVLRPRPPAPTFVVTSPVPPVVHNYVPEHRANEERYNPNQENEESQTYASTGYGESESR
jgi:hypothetical protein